MSLSAEQLALLNTLMYVEGCGESGDPMNESRDTWDALWSSSKWNGELTLGELLNTIPEDKLQALQTMDGSNTGAHISGSEYYNLIQTIKNDPELCSLKCADKDTYTDLGSKTVTFLSEDGGDAYIVYKGTGSGEWPDNFAGLDETDTKQQLAAKNYADYIHAKYSNADIYASGHSKGGNKAMYVGLLCPYIQHSYSFDGEGFSEAFLEKYESQASGRAGYLSSYNQKNDFVSPLLFDVSGDIHYVDGESSNSDDFFKWHSPITLFVTDEDGNLSLGKDGSMSEISKQINLFAEYASGTASDTDLRLMSGLLQQVVPLILKQKTDEAFEILFDSSNAEALATLLVYIEDYGTDKFEELLVAVSLMSTGFTVPFQLLKVLLIGLAVGLATGKLAAEIYVLLPISSDYVKQLSGYYKRKKAALNERNSSGGKSSAQSSTVRNYSAAKEQEILAIVDEIDNEQWFDPTRWDVWYRGEKFFHRLTPSRYANDMNTYYRKVMDIQGTDRATITKIFSQARAQDQAFASQIRTYTNQVSRLAITVQANLGS